MNNEFHLYFSEEELPLLNWGKRKFGRELSGFIKDLMQTAFEAETERAENPPPGKTARTTETAPPAQSAEAEELYTKVFSFIQTDYGGDRGFVRDLGTGHAASAVRTNLNTVLANHPHLYKEVLTLFIRDHEYLSRISGLTE